MSRSATLAFLSVLLKESFLALSKKHKIRFLCGFLILFFGCVLSAVVQILFRYLVDSVIIGDNNVFSLSIVFLISAYSVSWTINQIANIIAWLIAEPVLAEISQSIILKMFAHMLQVPYDFFLTKDARSVNTYFETVFLASSNILSNLIIYIIPSLLEMMIIFLFFIKIYPFWYGLFLLFLLFIFFYLTYHSIKDSKKLDLLYYAHLEKFHGLLIESISQIMLIKVYCANKFELDKIKTVLNSFFHVAKKRIWHLDRAQAFQIIASGTVLLLLSMLSGYAVFAREITPGDFVMINNYFIQFSIPITFLGYIFADVYRQFILLKKSIFIFKLPIEHVNKTSSVIINFVPRLIFESVSFSIEGKNILENISFSIEPGEKVAIIGLSGSGKSTCLKLIMQLYHDYKGTIKISDTDMKDLSSIDISRHVGIVLQQSFLFQGTIADNIRYGNKQILDEDVTAVLKKVKLYDRIKSLPEGIFSDILGIDFSGGEKQRIAIARALVRNPEIFLFDEITSSLDKQTEKEIQEYLFSILEGKTAVFVTHRLLFASTADKIIVMKKGKIISVGTHEELLKKCFEYQTLCEE